MPDTAIASPLRGTSSAVVPLGHFGRAVLRCREAELETLSLRLGIALPRDACRSTRHEDAAVLWLGPDEWLLLDPSGGDDWGPSLIERAGDTLCSIVDVSHRQVALGIVGARAEEILASGCALDLSLCTFPIGMCTRTMFAKVEIVLWRTAPDRFHIEVWRSFARYTEALLREAEDEA